MRRNTTNTPLRFTVPLMIVSAVLLCSGCASTGKTMKLGFWGGDEKVNLAPFAAQTMGFLGGPEYPISRETAVLIRKYLASDTFGMAELDSLLVESDKITDQMITYSVELVGISEIDGSTKDKIAALADTVRVFKGPIKQKLELSDEAFDERIAAIVDQNEFLDAIRAVQPLIDSVSVYYGSLMDQIQKQTEEKARAIDAAIDADFQPLIDFVNVLTTRRQTILIGLGYLHKARQGDAGALAKLADGGIIIEERFKPKAGASEEDLAVVEEHLLDRLSMLKRIHDEMMPDVEMYRMTHQELDREYERVIIDVAAARVKFVIWSRAHRTMASGEKDPAKWFDVRDAPEFLVKAVKKAVL